MEVSVSEKGQRKTALLLLKGKRGKHCLSEKEKGGTRRKTPTKRGKALSLRGKKVWEVRNQEKK